MSFFQQWTMWSLTYTLPSVKAYIRPPHCFPVTLNKNAEKCHFIQLEIIPQFYTPNLYIHPIFEKKIWRTIKNQLKCFWMSSNFYLFTWKSYSTQILLNWIVFKKHKYCLSFNSEHCDHWLIPYHLWKLTLDLRTVSQ